VDDLHAAGFHGIKFIWPAKNYDDDECLPVYERCEALGMPALFHLGIVARVPETGPRAGRLHGAHAGDLSRPGSRVVSPLTIIGAHLGNPDYDVAGRSPACTPTSSSNLTGSTLKKKSPAFLGEIFWWARTRNTGRWATACRPTRSCCRHGRGVELLADVRGDYERVMDALEMSPEDRAAILGGTAARIFGLE